MLALISHIGADLIRDRGRYLIYEIGACFDGVDCFVRVRNPTFDVVGDDNKRLGCT